MSGADDDSLDFDVDSIVPIDFEVQEGPVGTTPSPQAPVPAPELEGAGSGRALLSWKEGNNPGITYVVPRGMSATIGRDPTCAVSIFDKSLSRQHAVLSSTPEGRWVLGDPGSANGTFVNEKRIRQTVLSDGDQIGFGRMEVFFFQGDKGDESVEGLEGFRLAIRKKLVALSEKPDFIAKQLDHRLQPWMRDTKVMLIEPFSHAGEIYEAFTIGTLVLPPDPRTLEEAVPVAFLEIEEPVPVPPGRAALLIPEIEPIGYVAGNVGKGGIPLDAYTWGSRRMVVLEDHEVQGRWLSMGQIGKLDILAVGSGEFDVNQVFPVRLSGSDEKPVAIEIARLGRVVDEFENL